MIAGGDVLTALGERTLDDEDGVQPMGWRSMRAA